MLASIAASGAQAEGFDQAHAAWNTLVADHVQWNAEGTTSTVDYAGFARDAKALDAYLDTLSKIDRKTVDSWNQDDREAFLINAYNAATVKLILTRYPNLKSIKDLGGLFSSPWKKEFVDLLGERRSLDSIEHTLLRGASDYSDPRIHFAVNCASIGCPALRPEAYVGATLRTQLADQTTRFLKDRSRNRLASDGKLVQVSKIFDWYAGDFDAHTGGVGAFLTDHADALGLDAEKAQRLREGKLSIDFTDYDWSLNGSTH
ncbi:MAG TPA: DUF547 domain-containing protein [Dokdonella sp.]|uniref:DUF547 domain-containing protein n=1 Tax=Dokdonella sp. TaxID=2291710 RepID=UPI002D80FFF1|nr:DUF547 domain-containing protein [Dokdonella sp.]HET9031742.1 DUF547 domain-containing protein [Dokdonella sp.]